METELNQLIEKWIIKAENDLKVVQKELNSDDPVCDVTCYHCQQTAEKYLKAFLLKNGVDPEKTHLISYLIRDCIKFDNEFEELYIYSYLSEYAVEIRYPDDFYIPDIDETRESYKAALHIKEFVLKKLQK
jgi:HEPN domain-containing protein